MKKRSVIGIGLLFGLVSFSLYANTGNEKIEDLNNETIKELSFPVPYPTVNNYNSDGIQFIDFFIDAGNGFPLGKYAGHFHNVLYGKIRVGISKDDYNWWDIAMLLSGPQKKSPIKLNGMNKVWVDGEIGWDLLFSYRHKTYLNSDVILNKYAGAGLACLWLYRVGDSKELDSTVATLLLNGGMSIYYKNIGVFVEFNYGFYDWYPYFEGKLGGATINAGLSFYLPL